MLTADDQAKVLDFGLATAMGAAATSGSVADSPTMTARATQMGMIIGTAAYMSPEQARGKSKHIAFASGAIDSPYDRGRTSALWRVPAVGGEPVKLSEGDAVQPAWSPSGARIAVWLQEGGQRDLATVSADGGERLDLLDDAPLDWSPTWSPDGRFLYFSSDRGGCLGLWRLAIDEATGRAEGEPQSVANGLESSMSLPRFSADGRALIFRSETRSINPVVIPFDPDTARAGVPRELLRRIGILRPESVSPDGERLVLYNAGEPQEDISLMRTDGSGLRRLTDDVARDRAGERVESNIWIVERGR